MSGALTLSTAVRIGLLGDTHGDMQHLLTVSETMWRRGVSVLLVLGDFGFVWPGRNWSRDLDKISRRLGAQEQALYFVDGNHEDFTALYKFPIGEDGLRWLRPNLAHIPRGYRTTLLSGRTLAALGGANSVDASHRVVGRSLWVEESITEADLAVLGAAPADIMVGHDAPLGVPTLDHRLIATNHLWPESGVAYSAIGRQMFHRGFAQVRPQLYLGGHYHQHVDEALDFDFDGQAFRCRVVILDMNGSSESISQAILDVRDCGLEFFTRGDGRPRELTGREAGVWLVHTRDSIQVFDLDAKTTQRLPGPDAPSSSTDSLRPLCSLDICRVGEPAFWTSPTDDPPLNRRWFTTSEVVRIERMKEHP